MTSAPKNAPEKTASEEARRRRLLDAALATFIRYGFRKTSMEEVARAASISRQGLYAHFATKEELFRSTVDYALESGLEAAIARLHDPELSVEQKLCGAFDEWVGRYVGMSGEDVTDLGAMVGPLVAEREEKFIETIARSIRSSGLPAAYRAAGLTARQLADTLHATARGLKHDCPTRAAFQERLELAVRALCLPLRVRA